MSIKRHGGFTLIEMIIFVMIVSVAVGGVLGVMRYNAQHSADPMRRKQALLIAESLIEEVELAGFTWCDPADPAFLTAANSAACAIPETFGGQAGNARPFDNVIDYVAQNGVAQASFNTAGVLTDTNGAQLGGTGYSATVAITKEAYGPSGSQTADDGLHAGGQSVRIKVTVSYDGTSLVLEGYRTRYSPNL